MLIALIFLAQQGQKDQRDFVFYPDHPLHVYLQKLTDGGVTHIFVHSPQTDQQQVIDFYTSEVLPHLQR